MSTAATERWLEAVWPVVRASLPPAPARVVEIGCGEHGGFVPRLRAGGYDAIGVDPDAPEGEEYRRVRFEQGEQLADLDVVVASTSLHHVSDPVEVVDRIASSLRPGGALVVVEWDWESFDEPTADWCFARLAPDGEGWLHRRRDEWASSGESWRSYLQTWAREEGIHAARDLLGAIDGRFERTYLARGPYLFPDLAGTSADDELAAIDAGEIRATRIDYAGVRR